MEFGKNEAKRCVHGQPPFCTAACPFGLNVRDFVARLSRGRADAVYRIFRDAVGFPFIVAALCPAPCQSACVRCKTDDAIQLHELERAVCAHARNTRATRYNVPPKPGRVAIIGAGISGLGCALRLGMMHYDVSVYEKSFRIGGHLNDLLPAEVLQKDFDTQLSAIDYTLHLNTDVKSLNLGADVYYVATGRGGFDFDLPYEQNSSLQAIGANVLVGGSMTGADAITALAQGMAAAQVIDAFFKTGSLEVPKVKEACTSLHIDEAMLTKTPMVERTGDVYTEAEMTSEASRCLKCDCDICQKTCDLMGYYEKYPGRIVDEVEITVVPSVMFGHRLATRLIASCTQCGICRETCPEHIDMQTFLLESRREMERLGDMPKAWSSFWLEDMEHANGPKSAICIAPREKQTSVAFFPGCQLGASDPRYVKKTYETLLDKDPDTGLIVGCCGAPAYWAGREDLHAKVLDQLQASWESMGKPKLLLACPTCKKLLVQFLPEMETEFVYSHIQGAAKPGYGEQVAVFDPCSSRHEPKVQDDVRDLLVRCDYALTPLSRERENAQCCGYGGQTMIANPHFANRVVEQRIAQSELPYVTYCTNCRDTFAAKGKRSLHVLDAVFDLNDSTRRPPTWTERRRNREELRWVLAKTYCNGEPWGEKPKMILTMDDETVQKMQKDYILREDIEAVIEACERTGNKLVDAETNHSIGHLRIGYMTFWAEYAKQGEGFVLYDCYAHRMQIQEGE